MDRRIVFATLALMPAGVLWNCGSPPPLDYSGPTAQWPSYGNTAGGTRYSPLTQIDRGNVEYLELAWTYHTGDVSDGGEGAPAANKSAFQATPIVVDGTMYVATAFSRVIALDPETAAASALGWIPSGQAAKSADEDSSWPTAPPGFTRSTPGRANPALISATTAGSTSATGSDRTSPAITG